MADVEVSVIARAQGFDTLAAQAEKANLALKNMGNAARGANTAGGVAAKQLSEDLARVTNGLSFGQKLGTQIRTGMASAMGNQSFWTSTFSGMASRFQNFGKTVGKSMALGVQAGFANIRNMNGGHGPSRTDLVEGAILGGLTFKGVEALVKSASNRQQARLNLAATGLLKSPAQAEALEKVAQNWSDKYGNISTTEGLEFLTDQLKISGGTEHLFENHGSGARLTPEALKALNDNAALISYMKTYKGGEHGGQTGDLMKQFADGIRSSELLGKLDPASQAEWMERLTRISLATGVDPSQMLAAQRAAGAAFLTLNDDGIAHFARFVQENKQRAGVQLATGFMHMIGGNSQTVRGNEMLRKLGILPDDEKTLDRLEKEGKIERNKKGQISHVNDMSLIPNYQQIGQDPYAWDADTLYTSIRNKIKKDKGHDIGDIDKPLSERSKGEIVDMMMSVAGAFKNRNEATQALEAIIQAANLAKTTQNINKADIDKAARHASILHQEQTFADHMDDLRTNLGETILPTVNDWLLSLNKLIKRFAEFSKEHPDLTGGILKYGGGALMLGGGLAGLGLLLHMMKLPLEILKSIGIAGGYMLGGTGIGAFELFGGATSLAAMGQTSSQVKSWLGATGTIRTILGDVGKLMRILGRFFMAYQVGEWVANTDLGSTAIASWKERIEAWLHPGTSHGKEQLAMEHYWQRDRELRKRHPFLASVTTPVAKPDYLKTMFGDRAKYIHYAHKHGQYSEYWRHLRQSYEPLPASYYFGFAPVNGGGGGPNMGGQKTGPVPVVITNDKGQNRPNTITTNVTVNVQSNASPQAIGGAVGSAVGSKVSNALSDQHH